MLSFHEPQILADYILLAESDMHLHPKSRPI